MLQNIAYGGTQNTSLYTNVSCPRCSHILQRRLTTSSLYPRPHTYLNSTATQIGFPRNHIMPSPHAPAASLLGPMATHPRPYFNASYLKTQLPYKPPQTLFPGPDVTAPGPSCPLLTAFTSFPPPVLPSHPAG